MDNTATMVLDGGKLFGPTATTGAINETANFNWLGGTISLGGGFNIDQSGHLTASGGATKTLTGPMTNHSPFTQLGGAGGLGIGMGGSLTSIDGKIILSLPTVAVAGFGTSSFSNMANSTLEETAPASSGGTVIRVPFSNTGILQVDSFDSLTLVGPAAMPPTPVVSLDGSLQLSGNLILLGFVSSPTGFLEQAAPGFLLIGSSSTPGTLIVPGGATLIVNGNVEVTELGTLTGDGEVDNNGRLELGAAGIGAASTAGLGAYVQSSIGTLALHEPPMSPHPVLAVKRTARLSGTLILLDYTPVVGASFTVVTADGGIINHFDTIPDGMVETDGPTAVTVTQVRLPA